MADSPSDSPSGDPFDKEAAALYAVPPDRFTGARDERVRAVRGSDRGLADALRGLRRPTLAAWLVDLLVRDKREQVETLLALGGDLRAAQETLQGDALRRLTEQRRAVVGALVKTAVALGREQGQRVTQEVAAEVEATLDAALADPDAAAQVRLGRLDRPLSYSGFGSGAAAVAGGRPRLRPAPTPAAAPEPEPEPEQPDAAERRREERRQQIAAAQRSALEASGAADDAQREYDRRRAAEERAEGDRDAARERLDAARAALRAREQSLDTAEEAYRAAGRERDTAEREARAAHDAADQARAALDRLRRDE